MTKLSEGGAVESKVIVEPIGIPSNVQTAEDGANYLRRIKEETTAVPQSDAAPTPRAGVASTKTCGGKERRRSVRFRCSGSAEFCVDGSEVRMWGTLSDVSLHGCYVEMNNTFPVNTRVHLALQANGIRVQMPAVVRVSYPFLGMGLCFSEIEPGQQLQLEQMLAVLSGSTTASPPDPSLAPTAISTRSLADVDPAALLDRLTEFFRGNALLSRREFYEFARQSRR